MWITDRQVREDLTEPAAELGLVSLSGGGAVTLAGERRNVVLCLPGGYHWAPRRGETVLVVKSGPDRAPCVTGREVALPITEADPFYTAEGRTAALPHFHEKTRSTARSGSGKALFA